MGNMIKGMIKYLTLAILVGALVIAGIGAKAVFASTNGATIPGLSSLSSTSYVLVDFSSGKTLVEFNANEKMPVASICKLMTCLLTYERIEDGKLSLDDKMLTSQHAASVEGSQAFLDAGSEYTVAELLKSVIVASANDSAIVLAEGLAGSEEAFVELMNTKALELGMTNTRYTNATGLTTKDQYSTALDTTKVLKAINKYENYRENAKIWMDNLVHPSGRVTELVNTNRLIKYYPHCVDGKTGFTDEAGYCLSSVANKGDMKLIAVALNCKDAPSRFSECIKLFDYGFANYRNNIVFNADKYVSNIAVNYGRERNAKVGINSNLSYLTEVSKSDNYELIYDMPKVINAPLSKGEIVGSVSVVVDGEVVAQENLVLLEDIYKHNFADVIDKIADSWAM